MTRRVNTRSKSYKITTIIGGNLSVGQRHLHCVQVKMSKSCLIGGKDELDHIGFGGW